MRPGIGTVVVAPPDSSRRERTQLLDQQIEEQDAMFLKRMGIERGEMIGAARVMHWQRLSGTEKGRGQR